MPIDIRSQRPGGLSVFAFSSFVVYLITTLEATPLMGRKLENAFVILSGDKTVPYHLPSLWLVIALLHLFIATRLYLHAWAVDRLPNIDGEDHKSWATKCHLISDILLRSFWISLVSYLPTMFDKVATNQSMFFGLSLDIYYVLIFSAVLAWDLLMYRKVANSSASSSFVNRGNSSKEERVRLLRIQWIGIDAGLFLLSVLLAIAQGNIWTGQWMNWKPILYCLFWGLTGGVCLYQIFMWLPAIFGRDRHDDETGLPPDSKNPIGTSPRSV